MPYATLNGIRLHYEVQGEGDPVLLINGLGAPSVGFVFQVRDLAPHHRVITFDNRGVGESDAPAAPAGYPTSQMADDAAALLEHLGVRRAHVMGTSMGGTIAMELAIRHPRRVRSLALCCTWARGDARFLHAIRSWVALAPLVTLEQRMRHVQFPWIYSPDFLGQADQVEETLRRGLGYAFPTRAEALERQAQGLLAWNGTRLRELRRLRVPTLVLVGRHDILTPPAFSRELAGLIPRARLKVLPGGHAFFIEQAAAFNRALLGFWRAIEV